MSLGAVREPRRGQRRPDLTERRRREIREVRHPLAPDVRIDRVLVGPTGVHVVLALPAVPGSGPLVDAALVATCRTAAQLVGSLLPPRYGDRVRPVLCRADDADLAENVDGVLLTSRPTLEHVLAFSPVVLSTSEVNDIGLRLETRLEPFPAGPANPPRRTRCRFAVLAGAVAALSAGVAAGLTQVPVVLPLPW